MSASLDNKYLAQQLGLPLDVGEIRAWRPIHYLGSKLRLVESIREALLDLDPGVGSVCDLFAGSGTVALALSKERNVVAADIQEYSRVICTALLKPTPFDNAMVQQLLTNIELSCKRLEYCVEPILEFEQQAIKNANTNPHLLCDLVEFGTLLSDQQSDDDLARALKETRSRMARVSESLMATRYFGGVYFSYRQSLYIDCALNAISELQPKMNETYLSALLSMASAIVNSVGKQFAQPMRPRRKDGTVKRHLITQMCRDRGLDAGKIFFTWLRRNCEIRSCGSHRVLRGDYRDILPQLKDVSVIYADPPYTRDHYSRFYHVLETLCLRDWPKISTTSLTGNGPISRGLYRIGRHQSPFCIKSQAPIAFKELFEGTRKLDVPLLVSYSPFIKNGHPRLMTVEAVSKMAAEYYRHIQISPVKPIVHSKLNKAELHLNASNTAEVFIKCRP
ncbi:MAG TPA: DNA adenine methylase [Pyrinomonadaceae bacterium]|nr:DNA adenine methylase [Pyrinomonadaceae bacterium]